MANTIELLGIAIDVDVVVEITVVLSPIAYIVLKLFGRR